MLGFTCHFDFETSFTGRCEVYLSQVHCEVHPSLEDSREWESEQSSFSIMFCYFKSPTALTCISLETSNSFPWLDILFC